MFREWFYSALGPERNTDMGISRTPFALAVLVAVGSLVARANIVYAVDTTITSSDPTGNPLQTDTVDGTITTDGTIGVIGFGNIVSWNLDLIDGLNSANDFDLMTTNSSLVYDTGSALTATAAALSFDFSGSGEFLIQARSEEHTSELQSPCNLV